MNEISLLKSNVRGSLKNYYEAINVDKLRLEHDLYYYPLISEKTSPLFLKNIRDSLYAM